MFGNPLSLLPNVLTHKHSKGDGESARRVIIQPMAKRTWRTNPSTSSAKLLVIEPLVNHLYQRRPWGKRRKDRYPSRREGRWHINWNRVQHKQIRGLREVNGTFLKWVSGLTISLIVVYKNTRVYGTREVAYRANTRDTRARCWRGEIEAPGRW